MPLIKLYSILLYYINYMEYIKSLINDTNALYKTHFNTNNILILSLILYVSCIIMYMPRHIISLQNQPFVKILTLLMIVYYIEINPQLAILLAITFLVTINLESSIKMMENQSQNNIENFTENTSEENHNFTNNSESESEETESDSEESDSEASGSDSDTSEDFKDYSKKKNLRKSKHLNDNFTNLHKAMHQLEKFIPKK